MRTLARLAAVAVALVVPVAVAAPANAGCLILVPLC